MPRSQEANQEIRNETKNKILKAATAVFAAKGQAATMADIAAEAGISQGLAYHYFASKEEIFAILVKQVVESDGGPAERMNQLQGTPGTRLALLITYILQSYRENPGVAQIMYNVLEDETASADLRALVMRNGKVIQDTMRRLIIEGQATGEIANDNPDQLMVALLASFNGLMKRATMLGPDAANENFPDATIILRMLEPEKTRREQKMNRKGVCYDVGRVMMESQWRPKFDPKQVHRELEIIKNDLHCNTVRICGLDLKRLEIAAEDALTKGLEVWLSPEIWDRSQEETLVYLENAAEVAEALRQRFPGRVVLSVGSEATLFMQGMVEGENFMQRMNNPMFWENIKAGKHNEPLNAFLAQACRTVRKTFKGQVTYFSVPLERVDWSLFDFVGVDLYRDVRIKSAFDKVVKGYLVYNKPVVIGEFGCCTYRGADLLGGNGFIVVFGMMNDLLGGKLTVPTPFAEMLKVIPKVEGRYVRDESLQAKEIIEQLATFDAAGVEGAFVFTFVSPTSAYNDDPRFDLDLGSFSLVKSYPEKDTFKQIVAESAKQAKELGIESAPDLSDKFTSVIGKHGTTYTDMPWEPKESFKAVADYYTNH
jgi:AcrR family transcriptional regulator